MALKHDILSYPDGAVLARNHAVRLEEFVNIDSVTHRSGKPWRTAEAAVDKFGEYALYYVEQDGGGMVTHKGYISKIAVEPEKHGEEAEKFRKYITDDDTYDEFNDELDVTTFIVTGGERLESPFRQSELVLISTGKHVSENLTRQPAYVKQRPGDF